MLDKIIDNFSEYSIGQVNRQIESRKQIDAFNNSIPREAKLNLYQEYVNNPKK